MNKLFILLFLLPLSVLSQDHNRMQVLVLGTFHFGESNDFESNEMEDVLGRKRQKELEALRKSLAQFGPQKIFVENTPEFQSYWDNVYFQWKRGKKPADKKIEKNEIFQVGIKLAAELGNAEGVRCINYLLDDPLSKSTQSAYLFDKYKISVGELRPSYQDFFAKNNMVEASFKEFMSKNNSWKKLSIKEHLFEMNKEENLRQLHYFNVLAWMDNDINGVGVDLSSLEYYRNLQIVQNLYRNLTPKDKKVVIIIGAAHAQILKDMLKSHPVFELVDLNEYLK